MKSYNYRLKLLGIILGLILITPLHSQAKDDNTDTLLIQAQPRIGAQGAKAAAPQYVPGQFIVKLKEGKAVTDIQDLNVQFKVTVVKEVFEKTPSPEEELQQLNAKLANLSTSHSSWFWQLDKNSKEYKEYMAKLEQEKAQLQGQIKAQEELIVHLAERQQRAPEGVVTPNLENTYLLKTASEADIRLVIAAYQGDPNVEYAEPNYIGKAQLIPNDPRYKDQWSHKTTHAEEGWNITTGTPKVVIAIIDTGVDYTHEDLKDNIWKDPLTGAPGKDFVDIDTNAYEKAGYTLFKDADGKYKEDYIGVDDDPADYLGHGTMVAGVAAAKGNNSIGIAGVCYNCKIMPVRTGFDIITPDMGFSPTSKIETALSEGDTNSAAIRYAADKGADVINMSFSETGSNTLKSAIDYAHAKGVVLVACAGNDGNSKENFPAASEGVIAVGATEKDDSLSWYSNYGDWVDVVAPGTQILSCVPKTGGTLANSTGYHYDIGTSFSTPYVSGVAGLVISRYKQAQLPITNDQIAQMIEASCDDLGAPGKDDKYGFGRVNVKAALSIGKVNIAITSPAENSIITKGDVEIRGSAFVEKGFTKYELYCAAQDTPGTRIPIVSSNKTMENGLLGTWKPSGFSDGKYLITLKVTYDQPEKEFTVTVPVNLDLINTVPVLYLADKGAIIGRQLTFKVEATDLDDPATPEGQLTYLAQNLPPGAYFDSATQIFSWTPAEKDAGTYTVKFIVKDNIHTVSQGISISTLRVKETQITMNQNNINYDSPLFYGERIIWTGHAGFMDPNQVFMYDLRSGQISTLPISNEAKLKALYGDLLAYVIPDGKLYVYNVATGMEVLIANNLNTFSSSSGDVSIYRSTIIWHNYQDNGWQVYMYDMSTGTTKKIATGYKPVISGDKIVYARVKNFYVLYLYVYNLTTQQETQIFDNLGAPYVFSIYGDTVAWVSPSDSFPNYLYLYLYTISTGEKTAVALGKVVLSNLAGEQSICMYGNTVSLIIYSRDNRGNLYSIHLYDIAAKREIYLTNSYNMRWGESLFENKTAWVEYSGYFSIPMSELFFIPGIMSVSPVTTKAGSTLTITGTHFGYEQEDSKAVFADGITAAIQSWSDNKIVCTVPQNAKTGLLKVVTFGGESNGITIKVNVTSTITALVAGTGGSISPQGAVSVNYGAKQVFTITANANYNIGQVLVDGGVVGIPAGGLHTYSYIFNNVIANHTISASFVSQAEPPAITAQPSSQTVMLGSNATFSIKASSTAPLTYQWQKKASGAGTFTNISGAISTSYSFIPVASDSGAQFRCIVTNSAGNKTSSTAGLTVNVALTVNVQNGTVARAPAGTVTTDPKIFIYGAGTVVSLAARVNSGYSFGRWFGDLSGNTNPATITMDGNKTATANFAVQVQPPPAIATQPQSQTVKVGSNAIFSIKANSTAPLTYQWQKKVSGAGDFSNISGATGTSYSFIPVASDNAAQFRCIVTNSAGGVTSNVVTLALQVTITASITGTGGSITPSGAVSVNYDSSLDLTIRADSGYRINQVSLDGLVIAKLIPGPYIVNLVKLRANHTISASFVAQAQPPTITTQPSSQTVNIGNRVTFSIKATGTAPLVYQWQKKTSGAGAFANIGGATSTSYSFIPVASDNGAYFLCTVSNSAGIKTSNAAGLTVNVTLTVNVKNGIVTKKVNGQATTATSFKAGTVVGLTATANSGYSFSIWSGDASGSAVTATITMDKNKSVSANLSAITYNLALTAQTGGTAIKSPNKTTFAMGERVVLTARPTSGYTFSGWRKENAPAGAVYAANPLNLTMKETLTLRPQFTKSSSSSKR